MYRDQCDVDNITDRQGGGVTEDTPSLRWTKDDFVDRVSDREPGFTLKIFEAHNFFVLY